MGIFDIFSNSDAQNAAATQAQYLAAANSTSQPFINAGTQQLQQNYAAGIAPNQSQFNAGQAGQTQLGNLLGLNGAAGGASAQNTLQNLPGYQFALNQGAQNVMRNQASTGQLNSGATNLDLQAQGQGLASQNYFNYANQLQPFMGTANTAAGNIGSLYSGLGNQVNANQNTLAGMQYGTLAGQGNAYANADYANLAQSGAIFGGLTGLASAGLKAFSVRQAKELFGSPPKLVAIHNSGCGIYRYHYKGRKRVHYGFMVDEVEKLYPHAVQTGKNGMKYIVRARLG